MGEGMSTAAWPEQGTGEGLGAEHAPLPVAAGARLEVGCAYRIAFWTGGGPYRRVMHRTATFSGTSVRPAWDGRSLGVLEFEASRGSVLAVPPDEVVAAHLLERGGSRGLIAEQVAMPRSTAQRVRAQNRLQRVLAS